MYYICDFFNCPVTPTFLGHSIRINDEKKVFLNMSSLLPNHTICCPVMVPLM